MSSFFLTKYDSFAVKIAMWERSTVRNGSRVRQLEFHLNERMFYHFAIALLMLPLCFVDNLHNATNVCSIYSITLMDTFKLT